MDFNCLVCGEPGGHSGLHRFITFEQRELSVNRADLHPGLHKAAEAVCIYDRTDGFCHPRNHQACQGSGIVWAPSREGADQ